MKTISQSDIAWLEQKMTSSPRRDEHGASSTQTVVLCDAEDDTNDKHESTTQTATFGSKELTTKCPLCDGIGWVLDTRVEPSKLVACHCKTAERAAKLCSVLPEKLAACRFVGFRHDWQTDARKRQQLVQARVACEMYAANPHGWLFIHSSGGKGNGSGKSHLAASVAHELVARGQFVSFKRTTEIISNSSGDWDERAARMDHVKRVDCLLVDDVGKEYRRSEAATAYANSVLFEILDARYGNNLPTVLTSNYSPDELGTMKNYDSAIVSRIHGMSLMVTLDGDDYRRL